MELNRKSDDWALIEVHDRKVDYQPWFLYYGYLDSCDLNVGSMLPARETLIDMFYVILDW